MVGSLVLRIMVLLSMMTFEAEADGLGRKRLYQKCFKHVIHSNNQIPPRSCRCRHSLTSGLCLFPFSFFEWFWFCAS